jgi:transcriptional regulator
VYVPDHFAMSEDAVAQLLREHGAGDLVTATSRGLVATMLPFVFDPGRGPHGALLGHVARTNEHWRLEPIGEALVILRGPDAYLTPEWYASKRAHGRVVPTWNYVTAHVHGDLVVHDDVDWLGDLVRRLTDKHEADREHPWAVDDAPPAFVAGQLRAIVGVELRITRIEAKAKLSQNRPAADIDGVVEGTLRRGDDAMSRAVAAARPARAR